MRNKNNKFPIIVGIAIVILWTIVYVCDITNFPSKVGICTSGINYDVWDIVATLTSGVLTFLGVLWTICNARKEHEEDRKQLEQDRIAERAQVEKDRKNEEKNKAKPYLASAGTRNDSGFKSTLYFKTNDDSNHRGKITVLNDAVCVLKELVIDSNHHKMANKKAVVFSKENNVIVLCNMVIKNDCYLIGEDIYGNKYKYDLSFTDNSNTGSIIDIGMPIDYVDDKNEV